MCALNTLTERAAEHDGSPPWKLTAHEASYPGSGAPPPVDATLAGLTVLEDGRWIQAPLTAHLLSLLGAEVVRIEQPGGDPLRGMPPTCSGVSARWLALNRGKKAVEVDIKSAADRERLRAMAADADVFLHNWAPGKAAALGLDNEDLTAANPALVHAYTSGWADRLPGAPMGHRLHGAGPRRGEGGGATRGRVARTVPDDTARRTRGTPRHRGRPRGPAAASAHGNRHAGGLVTAGNSRRTDSAGPGTRLGLIDEEGTLRVVGRLKDVLIRGGANISPPRSRSNWPRTRRSGTWSASACPTR